MPSYRHAMRFPAKISMQLYFSSEQNNSMLNLMACPDDKMLTFSVPSD